MINWVEAKRFYSAQPVLIQADRIEAVEQGNKLGKLLVYMESGKVFDIIGDHQEFTNLIVRETGTAI